MMAMGLLPFKLFPAWHTYSGERNRRECGKAGKRGRDVCLLLFCRQLNGGQKAIIFPYVVSVKHSSHCYLYYSNLDFEKQKT